MSKTINYRDLDLNFTRHPFTNDVAQFTNSDSIKKALRNLLSFQRNDKLFHPEINSGIYDSLFENISSIHLDAVKTMVMHLIEKYEPRVKLFDVIILPNLDGNAYTITLIYTILNTQTPVNFSFTLTRSR
jgi:phage baseplate assembly protein W